MTARQITAAVVLWLAALAVIAVRQGVSVVALILTAMSLAALALLALIGAVFRARPRARVA